LQIHRRVLCEQSKHVIKKGDSGFDRRFPSSIQIKADGNFCFLRDARNFCLSRFHALIKANCDAENKPQSQCA